MNPTNLMKIIGDAEDDYILSALESRNGQAVKQHSFNKTLLVAGIVVLMLTLVGFLVWFR